MTATPDHHLAPSVTSAALDRTRQLIDAAAQPRGREDRRTRQSLRRLFDDPQAVEVTITLTDEVMRFTSPRSAASALRAAVRDASPRGFGLVNFLGLRAVAALSLVAPSVALRVVTTRVRRLTQNLILDSSSTSLRETFDEHLRDGLALNVNVLGEAVLGEREAADRLERVLEMIGRPDVNYVSVKLSSVVSQLLTIDHEGSLRRVSERLRMLYEEAQTSGTFVNLDMEEFRDLRLTLDAFMSVLSEPAFTSLSAGIVLQAYLPESHAALEELLAFAHRRHERGGALLKVRLVKGANLAMEHVEGELHGWRAAPYPTKADVDASYLRLLDVALRLEHAPAMRVGVASHNLFHVSWALEVATSRGVLHQLDVEMLEGMANGEARALVESGQPVLLYAPVARSDDFAVGGRLPRASARREHRARELLCGPRSSSPTTRRSSTSSATVSRRTRGAIHARASSRVDGPWTSPPNTSTTSPTVTPPTRTTSRPSRTVEAVRLSTSTVIDTLDHLDLQ